MALNELHSLLLIFAIAVVAPLLCEWVPRIRLPLVVAEIGLGILVGPQALGWAAAGPTIQRRFPRSESHPQKRLPR